MDTKAERTGLTLYESLEVQMAAIVYCHEMGIQWYND